MTYHHDLGFDRAVAEKSLAVPRSTCSRMRGFTGLARDSERTVQVE